MEEMQGKNQEVKPKWSEKIEYIEKLIELKVYSKAYVELITLLEINEDKVDLEGLKPNVEIGTIFQLLAKVTKNGEKKRFYDRFI